MKKITFLLTLISCIAIASCKKKQAAQGTDPRVPPDLVFKTGSGYLSSDSIASKQDTFLIGVIVTRTEDNLTNFNASVSYDGASTTSSFFNHQCLSSEYAGYSTDVTYISRNQTGTEKLTFSIVDRDGNITKKTIQLTIQ